MTPTPTIPPLGTPTATPTIPPLGSPTPIPTPTPTPTPAGQCAPVTFNESNHIMSMSTTTSGATIFYTSDGTTPTHNGGTATGSTQVYNGSFTTPSCADTQYYAIAYKSGYTDSNMTGYLSKHGSDFGCFGGMMMSSSQSQTIVFSVWDGDWALLEEYDNTGALVQKYLQGYHGLVKTFVSTAVYYYQDELGSTSHIASASGALIEWYQYNLYGKPQVYNVAGVYQPGATPQAQDLGNGGSRWMPELGLYDDRNRFMSPDLGRFLQPDPIGFKGDASNLYRYCGNDWANRTDPMGLNEATNGGQRVQPFQK
jgi:RHS repeat-associated protein